MERVRLPHDANGESPDKRPGFNSPLEIGPTVPRGSEGTAFGASGRPLSRKRGGRRGKSRRRPRRRPCSRTDADARPASETAPRRTGTPEGSPSGASPSGPAAGVRSGAGRLKSGSAADSGSRPSPGVVGSGRFLVPPRGLSRGGFEATGCRIRSPILGWVFIWKGAQP